MQIRKNVIPMILFMSTSISYGENMKHIKENQYTKAIEDQTLPRDIISTKSREGKELDIADLYYLLTW